MPQDGITAPADFNATTSCYVKAAWAGTATNCRLAGPDGSGYYTVQITNVVIPGTAKMLTGGVGYTYRLDTQQPLTQVSLTAYPYDTSTPTGRGVGGFIVAAPNFWKVATSFTGRRSIVSNAKCNACHIQLGTAPSFHAGQRNDAPTCSYTSRVAPRSRSRSSASSATARARSRPSRTCTK